MSLRLFALALVLFVSGCAGVQKKPTPTTPATAPDSISRDLPKYVEMFRAGLYDELLGDVNRKIEALPADERANLDPRLLYVRGLAYHKLGWFKEAKVDLLNATRNGRQISKSKDWLDDITSKQALLPPNVREIRDGERVIFRMHSFGTKGDAATVAKMLPAAYRINRQILGQDFEATTVLIFDKYDQFAAFRKIHTGGTPGSWYTAVTTGPLVQISLRDKKGARRARHNRAELYGTVVHETNHAMVNRLMGKTPLPHWFKEGLADCAGAQVNPDFDARRQRRIATLFQNSGKLLPVEKLGNRAFFVDQTELGIAMSKSGNRAGAPDPYAQSYGMMKFLLANSSNAQLQSFLRRVRESDDFDGSFAKEFAMTTAQFFELWKRDYPQKLAAQ